MLSRQSLSTLIRLKIREILKPLLERFERVTVGLSLRSNSDDVPDMEIDAATPMILKMPSTFY